MKPEVLMIIAKTNPVQLEPAVEAEYTVHKLNQTEMADCGSHIGEYKDRVRALITQTAPGTDPFEMVAEENEESNEEKLSLEGDSGSNPEDTSNSDIVEEVSAPSANHVESDSTEAGSGEDSQE